MALLKNFDDLVKQGKSLDVETGRINESKQMDIQKIISISKGILNLFKEIIDAIYLSPVDTLYKSFEDIDKIEIEVICKDLNEVDSINELFMAYIDDEYPNIYDKTNIKFNLSTDKLIRRKILIAINDLISVDESSLTNEESKLLTRISEVTNLNVYIFKDWNIRSIKVIYAVCSSRWEMESVDSSLRNLYNIGNITKEDDINKDYLMYLVSKDVKYQLPIKEICL